MTTSTADKKLTANAVTAIKFNAAQSCLDSSEKTSSAPAESASLTNLNICRNKHWRFISSYHGQWLQLPLELLESLAYSNHFSRPYVIDSAVFFDIVRIRRLVDEATNLSVRANNGTTSSIFNASLNAGLDLHRGGSKLSGERKFRMRELAVRKLSEAYHLDEIAASVATMQSASSLEDVAKMVLQRAPNDAHARYVHFFHEKIPSRALAESTSLQPLDEILQEFSMDYAAMRTRAMTRVLKEDYAGAMKDLTDALNSVRRDTAQHLKSTSSNVTRDESVGPDRISRIAKHSTQKLSNDQKPTGMEAQLHFQRANVYLSLACQSVEEALKKNWLPETGSAESIPMNTRSEPCQSLLAYQKVKLNAKRALRDFITFLSKLEYSSGDAAKINGTVVAALLDDAVSQPIDGVLDCTKSPVSGNTTTKLGSKNPSSRIYQVSDLFSPTPPTNLPPHPSTLGNSSRLESQKNLRYNQIIDTAGSDRVTYHPLLSEALHGLLLCHALLQTDTTTIHKHACMAARLISLSDGLPVFRASHSASRADWTDILSQTKDWLELSHSWDDLCHNNHVGKASKSKSSRSEHQVAQTHQTEMVKDDTTNPPNLPASKTLTTKHQLDLKTYSLGTDRAAIIKRWIMEAPQLPDTPVKPRKGKKKESRDTSLTP